MQPLFTRNNLPFPHFSTFIIFQVNILANYLRTEEVLKKNYTIIRCLAELSSLYYYFLIMMADKNNKNYFLLQILKEKKPMG